jgi:hypothetical protein
VVDLQLLIKGRRLPEISAHLRVGGGIIAALLYWFHYLH